MKTITENGDFIPHEVEEVAKLDMSGEKPSISKEDLRKQAMEYKRSHEIEVKSVEDDCPTKKKKPNVDK